MSLRINMPVHYEMMVSHSPSVFGHSPPAGFLADYSATHFSRIYDHSPKFCRPQVLTPPQSKKVLPILISTDKMPITPKSCLRSLKSETDSVPCVKTNLRTKKKVIFADDQGRPLTHTKIMSEPSNVPPLWSLKFLAQITQGLVSPHPSEQWTVDFKQPASDYLQFRQKIDDNNVSLENVIVKENESIIVGTVKVKNISFQKEVIVRATWDNWKSQEDIFCTYSQIYGSNAAYVVYDTFSFKITLPPSSRTLEFCICFRANDVEYWDNNDNKNYTLSKRSPPYGRQNSSDIFLPYEKNNKINNSQNIKNNNNSICSQPIAIPQAYQNNYPSPYW